MSQPDSFGSDTLGERLESWKEIAAYLKRGVTTVQRWEQQEALPVHRHQHDTRGSVYAFKSELDTWRAARHPGSGGGENKEEAGENPRKRWARWTASAIWLAVLAFGALALWTSLPVTGFSSRSPRVSAIQISPIEKLQEGPGPALAISPDGRLLVYVGSRDGIDQLYARAIDAVQSTPLRGTEHARAPFFSPDGKWVGFFAQSQIKKVRLDAGEVESLCAAAGNAAGATWSPNGIIVFAVFGSGLRAVAAGGGEPYQLSVPDVAAGEVDHRWPEVVQGRDAVLFTVWTGSVSDAQIAVASFTAGTHSVLFQGTQPRVLGPNRLLFVRGDGLWAVALDPVSLTVSGRPLRLLETVLPRYGGAADYSVARDGVLAHVPSRYASRNTVEWVDRNGTTPIAGDKVHSFPRISPDGTKIALMTRGDDARFNLWIYDLAGGGRFRLPIQGSAFDPVWTSDGRRITFGSSRYGPSSLYWIPADGSSKPERLLKSEFAAYPLSWSPGDRVLAYQNESPSTGSDVWLLSRDGAKTPLLTTSYSEHSAAFSPDGDWLAYVSNQTGENEVYVVQPAKEKRPRLVSKGGGDQPVWARDGTALYYRSLSGHLLFKVPVQLTPDPAIGEPVVLLDGAYESGTMAGASAANYDVARGERFIMIRQTQEVRQEIRVDLEWMAEVTRRMRQK